MPYPDTCVSCLAPISTIEEQREEKLMLQSTFCFHFVHRHCLLDYALKEFEDQAGSLKCP